MKRSVWRLAGVALLILASGGIAGAAPPTAGLPEPQQPYEGVVVADGFNTPTGVLIDPDGTLWVSESGVPGGREVKARNFESGEENDSALIGDTATVIRIDTDGTRTVVANLPAIKLGSAVYGAHHIARLGDTLYVPTTGWTADIQTERVPYAGTLVRIKDGQQSQAADLFGFELEHNSNGFQRESDPFGVAAGPDGQIYVTEAGANTLLRVNPDTGEVKLVAVFSGLPAPFPNPNRSGQMVTDPVPTGLDIDAEGNAYVGLFSGLPFSTGSAMVLKVMPDGKVEKYATELTMLTDVTFGPDGQLYGLTFAEFNGGFDVTKGMIMRIKPGRESEIVLSGVNSPTAIDFNEAGDAYVTVNTVGDPGSGQVMLYKGLTSRAAEGPVWDGSQDTRDDVAWVSQAMPANVAVPVATAGADQTWLIGTLVALAVVGVGAVALLFRRSRRQA